MKSKDLFILLSHIDEKYIVESAEKPEFHRRRPIRKAIVIAAAVIFCLAMCTTVLAVTPLGEMLFGNISLRTGSRTPWKIEDCLIKLCRI